MSKHSELDNMIVEFHDGLGDDDFCTSELLKVSKMLNGNCCALGHAKRYVREAMGDANHTISADDGMIVVKVFRDGGDELCSWRLLRWKPVRA